MTSAENSISEPPNLKICWRRIPQTPLQGLFAITLPPPPPPVTNNLATALISCDLIETNIKTEIRLSKDYWNFHSAHSRKIKNSGECACRGTLRSEKIV